MSALTTGRFLHIAEQTATVTRVEKEATPYGSVTYRRVADHKVSANVELWVDVASIIRQLGARAVLSRGKKAQALNGAIVVKSTNHRRLP